MNDPMDMCSHEGELDEQTTIHVPFFREKKGKNIRLQQKPSTRIGTVTRPARVAEMLALAHQIEENISKGKYKNRAMASRALGVTRARMTTLLDLVYLAPDIQHEVFNLKAIDGREPFGERRLWPITKKLLWNEQRELWEEVKGSLNNFKNTGQRF